MAQEQKNIRTNSTFYAWTRAHTILGAALNLEEWDEHKWHAVQHMNHKVILKLRVFADFRSCLMTSGPEEDTACWTAKHQAVQLEPKGDSRFSCIRKNQSLLAQPLSSSSLQKAGMKIGKLVRGKQSQKCVSCISSGRSSLLHLLVKMAGVTLGCLLYICYLTEILTWWLGSCQNSTEYCHWERSFWVPWLPFLLRSKVKKGTKTILSIFMKEYKGHSRKLLWYLGH